MGSPLCTRPFRTTRTECPIVSGGRDFDGNGNEGLFYGLPSWDPRNGLWFSGGQVPDPVWGTWGDIPTPGDFNGDGSDDFAVFRPSTGTWFVSCSTATNCPGATLTVPWGTAGDIPVPADYNNDGTTDYGVWRPSNGSWHVRNGASGATLVNGGTWGQFGDCPIAARMRGATNGTERLAAVQRRLVLWAVPVGPLRICRRVWHLRRYTVRAGSRAAPPTATWSFFVRRLARGTATSGSQSLGDSRAISRSPVRPPLPVNPRLSSSTALRPA